MTIEHVTPLCEASLNGLRPLTAHHLRARQRAESARANGGLAEGRNPWELLSHLDALCGHSPWTPALVRTLRLLMAPIPATDWHAGRPVNYRPVKDLAAELGLSPRALRYQVNRLMELGALDFQDSTNCRRYREPGRPEAPSIAYGFDLAPSILLLDEARERAEALRAERAALQRLRGQAGALRRRLRTLLLDPGHRASLGRLTAALEREFVSLCAQRLDRLVRELLEALVAHLAALLARCERALVDALACESPASEAQAVDNPLISQASVSKNFRPAKRSLPTITTYTNSPVPTSGCSRPDQGQNQGKSRQPSLAQLLIALPEELTRELPSYKLVRGQVDRQDLLEACRALRPRLGISPHAWQEAERLIGEIRSVVVLIITAARSADDWPPDRRVRNPGGFFRALARRAHAGEADLGASIHGIVAHRVAAARAFPRP